MKKLTTLFILIFIVSAGLFANPKVPKGNIDPLYLLSNDCQSCYRIGAFSPTGKSYSFQFIKYSLISDSLIAINISCKNEKEVDSIISNIDVSNLDFEFERLRKKIIQLNIEPTFSMKNDIPYKEIYTLDFNSALKS